MLAPTQRRGRGRLAVERAIPPALLLVLGLWQLRLDPALWYDEAYTRLAADVPITTLLEGIWNRTGVVSYLMDVPPSFNGPYYVLMHGWVALAGDSALALRLPSLLCSVAVVAVMAELARRIGGRVAGVVCGLVCAVSPLLVDEATQARSYGPAMLALSLCALWLHTWERTGRGGARIAVAGALAALLHWFCLPVLVGFALTAALTGRAAGATGPPRRRWAMPLALLVATIPAGALVAWSLLGGAQGAPTPLAAGWLLPVRAVVDWSGDLNALAVLATAVAIVGFVRGPARLLLLGWVVVPLALLTAIDLVHPLYYPRYLLFPMLGFALATALGVSALRPRALRAVVAAVLVAGSLALTLPKVTADPREPSPDAVALLAAEQIAGQPIVPADGRTALDLETYLSAAPRLAADLVLPPTQFTNQTTSSTVWLVRVVLKQNSQPVVAAEQRLIDAGWTLRESTQLVGTTTDLRVEQWVRTT